MHKFVRGILSSFFLLFSLSLPGIAGPVFPDAFSSGATFIDFDSLTGGNCNGCGDQVVDQFSTFGIVFNNPSYPGQVTAQTNATFGVPSATSPNVVWVFQGGLLGDEPAAPFQMLFSSEVHRIGFDFASSIDAFLLLEAYSGNQFLESIQVFGQPGPIGLGGFVGIETSVGMTRVDISYRPLADPTRTLNFFVDNVRFETVPEPSTFVFGLTGILALAVSRLRKGKRFRRR